MEPCGADSINCCQTTTCSFDILRFLVMVNALRSSHRIRMSWIMTRACSSKPSRWQCRPLRSCCPLMSYPTPSLASSVNSAKEESQHSYDSGTSASSQSNNNLQDKQQPRKLTVVTRQKQRYIGPTATT
ncbi:hypothetical protein KR200_012104 [Drosophila serrata]|nr:hypothetical protein KR200_012104 [Drosophila serrata]